jgi:hypothetical protein
MTLTYPMIGWGTADDISAYSQVGTATVTSAITDPFGGTLAYLVDDNDAAAVEYRYKLISQTADSTARVLFFAKAGTATITDIDILDNTAAATRCRVRLTWTAGVPAATLATGSGTIFTPILTNNGWYAIRFTADGVIAANANRLRLFGASATAASVGNTNYYVRNVVFLHYPDKVNPWAEPRGASAQAQSIAGTEDAWTVGTDFRLDFDGCWIPPTDLDDPAITGYAGRNESPGINCGIEAFIKAARDKNVLALVKDRTNPTTTALNSYLASPMAGAPALEPNAFQRYALSFRAASPYLSFATYWP